MIHICHRELFVVEFRLFKMRRQKMKKKDIIIVVVTVFTLLLFAAIIANFVIRV